MTDEKKDHEATAASTAKSQQLDARLIGIRTAFSAIEEALREVPDHYTVGDIRAGMMMLLQALAPDDNKTDITIKTVRIDGKQESLAWIPCAERLPEINVAVLVACSDWSEPGCAKWDGFRWVEDSAIEDPEFRFITWERVEITHWMPLPTVPAGGSK